MLFPTLLVFLKPNLINFKSMAKAKQTSTSFVAKPKRKRPGIHAKTKYSSIKTSKNYKKISRGQG